MIKNKKLKILIVGKNSFLAKNYLNLSRFKKTIKLIKYTQIKKINYDSYSHLINFSYDQKIYEKRYNSKNCIDTKICNIIKNKDIIYIYPSSRLIYKSKSSKLSNLKKEKNFYSINKLITENKVKRLRNKKYLILRIGNILDFNLDNKNMFISKLLNSLKNNDLIKFDLNKKNYKDFITIKFFTKVLDSLIILNKSGTFNISSGKKTNVYEIAKLIIKGYGKGNIFFEKKLYNDSFVLNNKKLKKITKLNLTKKEILDHCIYIGKKLKRVINFN